MKKNNEDNIEKTNKLKDLVTKFKEAWAIPQKRAGIKLMGYLIFFIVFFVIAGMGNLSSTSNPIDYYTDTTTTTTNNVETFFEKQKLLLENKHMIYYEIKIREDVYKINGTLNNGILEGYLETNEDIVKVRLEDSILYNAQNNEIVLEDNINLNFIDIGWIFNKIISSRAYIFESGDIKSYSYTMKDNEEYLIKVFTDNEKINKIEISSDTYNYSLNFDV